MTLCHILKSNLDLANRIVKVLKKCLKIQQILKQVCIDSDPSEGNLTKHMDKIQIISMIGEIMKTRLKLISSGTRLAPSVVCVAASIFWALGLLFHFDVIHTYNI